jgi:hypothetical protein
MREDRGIHRIRNSWDLDDDNKQSVTVLRFDVGS